jgi:hypothetical protein
MYKVWIGVVLLLVIGLGLLALYVKSYNQQQEVINQISGEWFVQLPEGKVPAYLAAIPTPITFRADGTGNLGKGKAFRWEVQDNCLVIDQGKPMPILTLDYRQLVCKTADGPVELKH